MARNTLEKITYQHVVYGAGTILSGKPNIRSALLAPEDFEAAILHAKQLLETLEPDGGASTGSSDGYDSSNAYADLRQVLDLYNATVIDGRFIDDLATAPKSVAARLGLEISDAAAAAIEEGRKAVVQRFGTTFSVSSELSVSSGKKIVAVAIAAIIVIRADEKPYEIIVDSSGVIKV